MMMMMMMMMMTTMIIVIYFTHIIIPFGKFGPTYLGKATTAAKAALPSHSSACLFCFSCFRNPPNSGMDYRVFSVRTWSFLCVRIHTGFGHTDSESAQHFRLGKTHFSCAPGGVRTDRVFESRVRRTTNWATPSPLMMMAIILKGAVEPVSMPSMVVAPEDEVGGGGRGEFGIWKKKNASTREHWGWASFQCWWAKYEGETEVSETFARKKRLRVSWFSVLVGEIWGRDRGIWDFCEEEKTEGELVFSAGGRNMRERQRYLRFLRGRKDWGWAGFQCWWAK